MGRLRLGPISWAEGRRRTACRTRSRSWWRMATCGRRRGPGVRGAFPGRLSSRCVRGLGRTRNATWARRSEPRRRPSSVGKGEARVSQPLPPRCRSGVNPPHLPACGSRTGRPQPKLPQGEESRGVLDHDDRGTGKTLPGSASQVGGRKTAHVASDCRHSSSACTSWLAIACESTNRAYGTYSGQSRSSWQSSSPSPESLG